MKHAEVCVYVEQSNREKWNERSARAAATDRGSEEEEQHKQK